MSGKPKTQIRRGDVFLAKFGRDYRELHVLDVLMREGGESMVKHQYQWETLGLFASRHPVRIGRTRRILGIRCGVIRERN